MFLDEKEGHFGLVGVTSQPVIHEDICGKSLLTKGGEVELTDVLLTSPGPYRRRVSHVRS